MVLETTVMQKVEDGVSVGCSVVVHCRGLGGDGGT